MKDEHRIKRTSTCMKHRTCNRVIESLFAIHYRMFDLIYVTARPIRILIILEPMIHYETQTSMIQYVYKLKVVFEKKK